MADDAPPELPPREAATPPELPPREAVESLSLEEDVADLDAAAAEGYEEEAADAIFCERRLSLNRGQRERAARRLGSYVRRHGRRHV